MRRPLGLKLALALCVVLCVVACLSGQSRRSAYQQAFQAWRQSESNLEFDSSTAGAALTPRANRQAALAAEYGAERIGYLRSASEDLNQHALAIKNTTVRPLTDLAPAADLQQIVGSESQVVATAIASFANDPDRGIQQLRQAMERERAALTALSGAINDRQKTEIKTAQATAAIEKARGNTGDEYGKLSFGLAQAAAQMDKETSTWATYYQKLAAAAASEQSSVATPPAQTARVTPPASTTSTPPPSSSSSKPPIPLARYVGGWTFPTTGGQFHGTQPEFIDLVVHEENGRVNGTLYGRFKIAAGQPGDPVLRFDFEGQWQAGATQTFALMTGDGAKGTIDLIPGPAFNLIEVNFQTEPKPDKVRLGNFILLKK